MEQKNDYMIECESLVKIYKTKDLEVLALQGLDLTVERGELTAIIGNSGSGKSTFLNMIGGLDRPSAGKLFVDGKNLFKMSAKDLVEYKRSTVGFVWQNNGRNLLPYLSAIENITVPMIFQGGSEAKKRERALELLDVVGLSHRKDNKLGQLSGGEQQRVAIAIALANNPNLLLADEPTGALDKKTGTQIMELLHSVVKENGIMLLLVTHDPDIADTCDTIFEMDGGRITCAKNDT